MAAMSENFPGRIFGVLNAISSFCTCRSGQKAVMKESKPKSKKKEEKEVEKDEFWDDPMAEYVKRDEENDSNEKEKRKDSRRRFSKDSSLDGKGLANRGTSKDSGTDLTTRRSSKDGGEASKDGGEASKTNMKINDDNDDKGATTMERKGSKGSSVGSVRDLSEEDKIALWMPRGMTTPPRDGKGSRSSSVASPNGQTSSSTAAVAAASGMVAQVSMDASGLMPFTG